MYTLAAVGLWQFFSCFLSNCKKLLKMCEAIPFFQNFEDILPKGDILIYISWTENTKKRKNLAVSSSIIDFCDLSLSILCKTRGKTQKKPRKCVNTLSDCSSQNPGAHPGLLILAGPAPLAVTSGTAPMPQSCNCVHIHSNQAWGTPSTIAGEMI